METVEISRSRSELPLLPELPCSDLREVHSDRRPLLEIIAVQKREAREGLDRDMTLPTTLQQLYGMEVVQLSPTELEAFRQKTRPVYNKWVSEIGVELVRRAGRGLWAIPGGDST